MHEEDDDRGQREAEAHYTGEHTAWGLKEQRAHASTEHPRRPGRSSRDRSSASEPSPHPDVRDDPSEKTDYTSDGEREDQRRRGNVGACARCPQTEATPNNEDRDHDANGFGTRELGVGRWLLGGRIERHINPDYRLRARGGGINVRLLVA